MQFTAKELADRFAGEILGNENHAVTDANSIEDANSSELSFAINNSSLRALQNCRAGIVLLESKNKNLVSDSATYTAIFVEDPMDIFLEILQEFRPDQKCSQSGISPDAHIHNESQIGDDCNIFAGVTIDSTAKIGDRCTLYPGVYIGPGCEVGNDTTLHPNVVLQQEVTLGDNIQIFSGAVLGTDGFGYRLIDGAFKKNPHCGRVRVENDVEIGANATIDRAMIGETIIGEGTKLDNLVMVGHNCHIGAHNVLASLAGMAGSSSTGEYTRIGGQVGVSDHVVIGKGCSIAAKAGVHRDVPDGDVQLGAPASPIEEQRRVMMSVRKLPDMRVTVRKLKKDMDAIQQQMAQLLEQEEPVKTQDKVA